jgi:hypothetical protein
MEFQSKIRQEGNVTKRKQELIFFFHFSKPITAAPPSRVKTLHWFPGDLSD